MKLSFLTPNGTAFALTGLPATTKFTVETEVVPEQSPANVTPEFRAAVAKSIETYGERYDELKIIGSAFYTFWLSRSVIKTKADVSAAFATLKKPEPAAFFSLLPADAVEDECLEIAYQIDRLLEAKGKGDVY